MKIINIAEYTDNDTAIMESESNRVTPKRERADRIFYDEKAVPG